MAIYLRSQTVIPTTGTAPDSVVVWNLHWSEITGGETREAAAINLCGRITNFINSITPQTMDGSLGWASYMRPNQAYTNVYDLVEPKPRVPFHTQTTASAVAPATTAWDLPPEVALCVSYQSTRISGKPQNRRRGRLFVGPLQVYQVAALDIAQPTTAACDALCTKVRTNLQPGTVAQIRFSVLSRQTWAGLAPGEKPPVDPNTGERPFPEIPGNLGDAMANVVEFWCDNAWDTQRRRGIRATTRSNQPVP